LVFSADQDGVKQAKACFAYRGAVSLLFIYDG
jgi:hypothetical protein